MEYGADKIYFSDKKTKLHTYIIPYLKITSRKIKDLSVRNQVLNILREILSYIFIDSG